MLLSLISGISAFICEALSLQLISLIAKYLKNKPDGLQTPLDLSIIDCTRVWNLRTLITDIAFFSGLIYGQFSHKFALSLLWVQSFLFYSMISIVQITLVLKVVMIFKGHWINDWMDEQVRWICRVVSVGYAGLWFGIDCFGAKARPRFLLTLMTGSNEASLVGPHGFVFAPPIVILVTSMLIFWINKPSLNTECGTDISQMWKNIGKGILLTGLAGGLLTLFFVITKYFLEPDTTEIFVLFGVITEALINLPPPLLFIISNFNLNNFVKSWLESNLPTPLFNFLVFINRVFHARSDKIIPY